MLLFSNGRTGCGPPSNPNAGRPRRPKRPNRHLDERVGWKSTCLRDFFDAMELPASTATEPSAESWGQPEGLPGRRTFPGTPAEPVSSVSNQPAKRGGLQAAYTTRSPLFSRRTPAHARLRSLGWTWQHVPLISTLSCAGAAEQAGNTSPGRLGNRVCSNLASCPSKTSLLYSADQIVR